MEWGKWIRRIAFFTGGVPFSVVTSTAQSWGGNDQVLTIDASAFQGVGGAVTDVDDAGYANNPTPDPFSSYDAPLPLPEGALIEQVCLYAKESDTGAFEYVQVSLGAGKLVPGRGRRGSRAGARDGDHGGFLHAGPRERPGGIARDGAGGNGDHAGSRSRGDRHARSAARLAGSPIFPPASAFDPRFRFSVQG